MKRALSALSLCLLAAGCPSSPSATPAAQNKSAEAGKPGEVAKPADKDAAEPAAAAPPSDAPTPTAVADATAPGKGPAKAEDPADHAGCIYAGTDKDEEASCPHGGGEHEEKAAPSGEGHFGDPFALAASVPLSQAITAAGPDAVRVAGEVEAVCQKKGCWMVVKDGEQVARVLMKDHAFTVPMDSRGKKVQVEGTLTSRTFDEAQVKHLEKDAGGDPSKVAGTRTEHVLTATGVLIQS